MERLSYLEQHPQFKLSQLTLKERLFSLPENCSVPFPKSLESDSKVTQKIRKKKKRISKPVEITLLVPFLNQMKKVRQ